MSADTVFQVVRDGRFKKLSLYLRDPQSVVNRTETTSGRSLLMTSLELGHEVKRFSLFTHLMRLNADCNFTEERTGTTVLMLACKLNRTKEALVIIEELKGQTDLNVKDRQHRTALHYAVESDNEEIVRAICGILRDYDCTCDPPDLDGVTPYLLAIQLGHDDVADVLVEEFSVSPRQFDRSLRTNTAHHRKGKRDRGFLDLIARYNLRNNRLLCGKKISADPRRRPPHVVPQEKPVHAGQQLLRDATMYFSPSYRKPVAILDNINWEELGRCSELDRSKLLVPPKRGVKAPTKK